MKKITSFICSLIAMSFMFFVGSYSAFAQDVTLDNNLILMDAATTADSTTTNMEAATTADSTTTNMDAATTDDNTTTNMDATTTADKTPTNMDAATTDDNTTTNMDTATTADNTINEDIKTEANILNIKSDDGSSSEEYKMSPSAEWAKSGWKKTSALYKGFGWGFFSAGVALGLTGTIMFVTVYHTHKDSHNTVDDEESEDYRRNLDTYRKQVNIGTGFMIVGSAFIVVGASLLIAEAVKFKYLREVEQKYGFTWQPQFYASPEMAGFGINGRF